MVHDRFYGEIYNHATVRRRLEQSGYTQWRGHSDTETLIPAVQSWGSIGRWVKAPACSRLYFDNERSELHLARDRLDEKPLYYGWVGGFVCGCVRA